MPVPTLQRGPISPPKAPVLSRFVPTPIGHAELIRDLDGWCIRYPDGVAFEVARRDSLSITIQGHSESLDQFTRMAGPLLAMVMDRCGFYPLHASGVMVGGRMLAVHGPSGSGKSTLAGCLAASGLAISGDDLLPLNPQGTVHGMTGSLRVDPAYAPRDWTPLLTLPDGRGWFPLDPLPSIPLSALLLLDRGEDASVTPVRGADRLAALLRAGFLSHLDPTPRMEWHYMMLGLSELIPVYRLTVPGDLAALHASRDHLISMLGDLPA